MAIVVDNKRGISYLRFGDGDILMGTTNSREHGLQFTIASTKGKYEIGKTIGLADDVETDTKVLMQFGCMKSIDTLIRQLVVHRKHMLHAKKQEEINRAIEITKTS